MLRDKYIDRPLLEEYISKAGFVMDRDSPIVPLGITLINKDLYLADGLKAFFDPVYRSGDSFFTLATEAQNQRACKEVQELIDSGKDQEWIANHELLRKSIGQTIAFIFRKPLN